MLIYLARSSAPPPPLSNEHLTATVAVGNGNNNNNNNGGGAGSARTSATCSLASSRESSTSNAGSMPYRVLMLGSAAVGKSSLVSQFMTSEYLHAYDTSIGKRFKNRRARILYRLPIGVLHEGPGGGEMG